MKQTHYTAYYLNNLQEDFWAFSFNEAIVLATAHAIERGRDNRIRYVYDNDRGEQCKPDTQVTLSLHK